MVYSKITSFPQPHVPVDDHTHIVGRLRVSSTKKMIFQKISDLCLRLWWNLQSTTPWGWTWGTFYDLFWLYLFTNKIKYSDLYLYWKRKDVMTKRWFLSQTWIWDSLIITFNFCHRQSQPNRQRRLLKHILLRRNKGEDCNMGLIHRLIWPVACSPNTVWGLIRKRNFSKFLYRAAILWL